MIGVSVLGSTGSVGRSTLDVLKRHADRYRVVALAAHSDVDGFHAQCLEHRPKVVAMADGNSALRLAAMLSQSAPEIEVLTGIDGVVEVARHADAAQVMAAIVGAAGLLPALAAVRAGKRLLLANKEVLVMAGRLFMAEAKKHGAEVLPIDSEHNALFQCLPANRGNAPLASLGVSRILLTASGGPFRQATWEQLQKVTPEQACAHPNWSMGRKISVDSASLMNKGLEVIEARWLFDAKPEQIQVVVHPQSIIHSLVQYVDGSVLAQLGNPDMRTPIAHALAWPERISSGVADLDLFSVAHLDFEQPDADRFPCLRLAYEAIGAGGSLPAILNAANEVAVDAFLNRRLAFTQIAELNERVMNRLAGKGSDESVDELQEIDQLARRTAEQVLMEQVN